MIIIFTIMALLSAFRAIFLTGEIEERLNLWAWFFACGGGALFLWIVNGV